MRHGGFHFMASDSQMRALTQILYIFCWPYNHYLTNAYIVTKAKLAGIMMIYTVITIMIYMVITIRNKLV